VREKPENLSLSCETKNRHIIKKKCIRWMHKYSRYFFCIHT